MQSTTPNSLVLLRRKLSNNVKWLIFFYIPCLVFEILVLIPALPNIDQWIISISLAFMMIPLGAIIYCLFELPHVKKQYILTPFNADQIRRLAIYQSYGFEHPYTCATKQKHGSCNIENLIPTVNGWSCPCCDYIQRWAHRDSTNIEDYIESRKNWLLKFKNIARNETVDKIIDEQMKDLSHTLKLLDSTGDTH